MTGRSRFPLKTRLLSLGMALTFVVSVRTVKAQQPYTLDAAAPELVGGPWLNTAKGAPIRLAARKGKVTIVEFWTFG